MVSYVLFVVKLADELEDLFEEEDEWFKCSFKVSLACDVFAALWFTVIYLISTSFTTFTFSSFYVLLIVLFTYYSIIYFIFGLVVAFFGFSKAPKVTTSKQSHKIVPTKFSDVCSEVCINYFSFLAAVAF